MLRKPALLLGGSAAQAESQAFLPQQGVAAVPRSKTGQHKKINAQNHFLTSANYTKGKQKRRFFSTNEATKKFPKSIFLQLKWQSLKRSLLATLGWLSQISNIVTSSMLNSIIHKTVRIRVGSLFFNVPVPTPSIIKQK